MIRENVEIDFKMAKDWAIKSHCSNLCERLEVLPNGELMETAEPSDNTWHTIKGTTEPLRGLYRIYNSCGCNCDWCADYDRYENRIENPDDCTEEELAEAKEQLSFNEETKDYDSKEDYFSYWIADTDEVSNVLDRMEENLEDIPYGYFDDEE